MGIIYWMIFGLIAGGLAEYLSPGSAGGFLGSMILGLIGAVVGGFLGQRLFGVGITGFNLSSIVIAAIGAMLVLALGRLLRGA